jgi:hypothetical protein
VCRGRATRVFFFVLGPATVPAVPALAKFTCYTYRGKTHTAHIRPELGTRGMRGSKPAGFGGVGDRAALSLDRVSRRRGPRLSSRWCES